MIILKRILVEKDNRKELIREFQDFIWNDENRTDMMNQLALDLDYYEPDEKMQNEFVGYYGDDKLEDIIKGALSALNKD